MYITEYSNTGKDSGGRWTAAPQEPPIAEQTVVIGAGSLQSSPFNVKTALVRLHTDAICSKVIGSNPTATAANARMAAGTTEYVSIDKQAGADSAFRIAVIQNT